MANIRAILAKEFKSDFRNPYTLAGAGLFLMSSLFVCYITIKRINAINTWTALFWIIVLFASFNAAAKGFISESRARMLYVYTLVKPTAFIGAKMLYHALVLIIMSTAAMIIYQAMFKASIEDHLILWSTTVLGATGFAFILSLLSSIASKAGNNLTLMAILGLPVMLPLLLVTTTLTKNAADGIAFSIQWKYLFTLAGLNIVSFALSVILFPYLWRE